MFKAYACQLVCTLNVILQLHVQTQHIALMHLCLAAFASLLVSESLLRTPLLAHLATAAGETQSISPALTPAT